MTQLETSNTAYTVRSGFLNHKAALALLNMLNEGF